MCQKQTTDNFQILHSTSLTFSGHNIAVWIKSTFSLIFFGSAHEILLPNLKFPKKNLQTSMCFRRCKSLL